MKRKEQLEEDPPWWEANLIAQIVKALEHPTRVRIIGALLAYRSENPLSFTKLQKIVGNPRSNALAYHLNQLQKAGLIRQLMRLPVRENDVIKLRNRDLSKERRARSFYTASPLADRAQEVYRILAK